MTEVADRAVDGFREWLQDRRNSRQIPHRMEAVGYVPVRNDAAKDGKWKIGGRRQVVYARRDLTQRDRIAAARALAEAARMTAFWYLKSSEVTGSPLRPCTRARAGGLCHSDRCTSVTNSFCGWQWQTGDFSYFGYRIAFSCAGDPVKHRRPRLLGSASDPRMWGYSDPLPLVRQPDDNAADNDDADLDARGGFDVGGPVPRPAKPVVFPAYGKPAAGSVDSYMTGAGPSWDFQLPPPRPCQPHFSGVFGGKQLGGPA